MISAWVLSLDVNKGTYQFVERNGMSTFNSRKPGDWGLDEDQVILLVLQHCSFIQAWVKGVEVRRNV